MVHSCNRGLPGAAEIRGRSLRRFSVRAWSVNSIVLPGGAENIVDQALDLAPSIAVQVFGPLVIRYGVVAREEAYLGRKFGDVCRGYCSRVRRWQ